MSDIQLSTVSGNNQDPTTAPQLDAQITKENQSKRRSVTSPAVLELNSLPLPKAKKSPVRVRLSTQRFESGDWTLQHPKNAKQPIKATFTPVSDRYAQSIPKSLPMTVETPIDASIQLDKDLGKKHSI